jgi:agmatine deiminase
VCASYINFYIANGGIIVPVFDDPADRDALEALERAFPDRVVVPVPGIDIVRGGGCIHCITQQEPRP